MHGLACPHRRKECGHNMNAQKLIDHKKHSNAQPGRKSYLPSLPFSRQAGRGTFSQGASGWRMAPVSTPRGKSFEDAKLRFEDVQAALEQKSGTVRFAFTRCRASEHLFYSFLLFAALLLRRPKNRTWHRETCRASEDFFLPFFLLYTALLLRWSEEQNEAPRDPVRVRRLHFFWRR